MPADPAPRPVPRPASPSPSPSSSSPLPSLDAMLADLETLVTCESYSADLAAVARSAQVVAEQGARLLGARPQPLVSGGVSHLRWSFGTPRVLLLGHHDTVWPTGTLKTHPFSVREGEARRARRLRHEGGPGADVPRAHPAAVPRRCLRPGHRRRGGRFGHLPRPHRGDGARLPRRARPGGVGRRRRAQDRTQGRLALRTHRPRPRRPLRARTRERRQRGHRTGPPAPGVGGDERHGRHPHGAGHHHHAHRDVGRHHHQHRAGAGRAAAWTSACRARRRRTPSTS